MKKIDEGLIFSTHTLYGIKNKDTFVFYFVAPDVKSAAKLFFNYALKIFKSGVDGVFNDYTFIPLATITGSVVHPNYPSPNNEVF